MDQDWENKHPRIPSRLVQQLLKLKVWFVERFHIRDRQLMLVWAALIGLLGAVASECFRRASDLVHLLATGNDMDIIASFARLPLWQKLLVPTAGGFLAGLTLWIGNRFTMRLRQKTTTDYMEAIVVGNGNISVAASLVKSTSALFSISSGASIGREGPLVQISSLVASLVGRARSFPVAQRRHLVACGAAAGIPRAHNAPIAGSFFLAIISPDFCGNGQGLLNTLFRQNWFSDEILAILLLKVVATAATFGSGAVGGVFTPTLFIGASLGMLYGRSLQLLFPGFNLDPGMYGIIGMCSFISASTGAPLMSILMGFELTLDYTLAPLLMVSCVIAYYCSSIFEKQFIYGESLERKGASFFKQQLAETKIADLIRRDPVTLLSDATFAEIAKTFVQHRLQHIYIVGKEKQLLGAVSLHDIKEVLDQPELAQMVIAADLMNENFPRISPLPGMGEALERFSEVPSERLPVVENFSTLRLIGSISQTDIMLHLAGKESLQTTPGAN